MADQHDVDAAVAHANAAFSLKSPWRTMSNCDRRNLLLRFADLLERDQEHLAYLTRLTLGAPYMAFGKGEIDTAIENFRCKNSPHCPFGFGSFRGFLIIISRKRLSNKKINQVTFRFYPDYAGWIDKFAGESFPADDGYYKIVRYEPLGVVAGYVHKYRLSRAHSDNSC